MSGSALSLRRRVAASLGVVRPVASAVLLGSLPSCVYHPYGDPDACTAKDRTTSVECIPLAPPPRPISPRSPESVAVVITPPTYPFVETALLEARQNDLRCSNRSDVVAELRATAGRMGCDLVIIFAGNDETYSYQYGAHATRRGYRATCGVYYGSPARAGASPASAP